MLDGSQTSVVALSNLYAETDCQPGRLIGLVVGRQFDKQNVVVSGVTVEGQQGERTFVNVDVDLNNVNMATRSWVVRGLQTLLKEGNRVLLGVKLCGAAGRVMMIDAVSRSR